MMARGLPPPRSISAKTSLAIVPETVPASTRAQSSPTAAPPKGRAATPLLASRSTSLTIHRATLFPSCCAAAASKKARTAGSAPRMRASSSGSPCASRRASASAPRGARASTVRGGTDRNFSGGTERPDRSPSARVSLAQVSLRATVRLKTGAPSFESMGSTKKNPSRSN